MIKLQRLVEFLVSVNFNKHESSLIHFIEEYEACNKPQTSEFRLSDEADEKTQLEKLYKKA
jgi:hypothetical protein